MKHRKKPNVRNETAGVPEIHKWDKFSDVARACDRFMDKNGMKRGFMGFEFGAKNSSRKEA